MRRTVRAALVGDVLAPAALELQVAVAAPAPTSERLTVTLDGRPMQPRECVSEAGGRLQLVDVRAGRLEVSYGCVVDEREAVATQSLDAVVYRRPSRYAESDALTDLAGEQFGSLEGSELVTAVGGWVNARLEYVSGSSTPTDSARDTLRMGRGVCRDFAHVTVALLRARDVPARVVAVYAPGLAPMDFHAVAEALVDGVWQVVDATRLAPRQSMVRISTGRDAADTAFLTSYGGEVRLESLEILAVTDGPLPVDDPRAVVVLG